MVERKQKVQGGARRGDSTVPRRAPEPASSNQTSLPNRKSAREARKLNSKVLPLEGHLDINHNEEQSVLLIPSIGEQATWVHPEHKQDERDESAPLSVWATLCISLQYDHFTVTRAILLSEDKVCDFRALWPECKRLGQYLNPTLKQRKTHLFQR